MLSQNGCHYGCGYCTYKVYSSQNKNHRKMLTAIPILFFPNPTLLLLLKSMKYNRICESLFIVAYYLLRIYKKHFKKAKK